MQKACVILTKCLAQKTDNPRKNIEVCVLRKDGLTQLDADAMDRIVTDIEKEQAMEEEKQ